MNRIILNIITPAFGYLYRIFNFIRPNRISVSPFIFASLILLCSGCAKIIDESNVDSMLQQFADGRIELGPITLFHEMYRERMWTYYNRQEWESLAKAVIQGNTNIDLDWYYLARSAEGLGLDKAAKIYYINALSTIHKCHRSSGYRYNDDCHGFNFPEAINARLEALR